MDQTKAQERAPERSPAHRSRSDRAHGIPRPTLVESASPAWREMAERLNAESNLRERRLRRSLALADVVALALALVDATTEPDLGLEPDLERALSSLGGREREIIALRFGGDLTGPEIAETTGLSLANVQQILSRSLRRMRAVIDEETAADRTAGGGSPG